MANFIGFPGGSVVENLPANAEELGLIPGSGRSPGEGNCNPVNPIARGTWWARVHEVTKESGHDLVTKQKQ